MSKDKGKRAKKAKRRQACNKNKSRQKKSHAKNVAEFPQYQFDENVADHVPQEFVELVTGELRKICNEVRDSVGEA